MGTACYSKKQKKQDNQQNITPQSFSDSFKTISPIQPTQSGEQQNDQIIWKEEMLMSIQNEQIEDPDLIPPRLYFNSSQKKEEKETFGGKKKIRVFDSTTEYKKNLKRPNCSVKLSIQNIYSNLNHQYIKNYHYIQSHLQITDHLSNF